MSKDRWRPIDGNAPLGVPVMVYNSYSKGMYSFRSKDWSKSPWITHWRPLHEEPGEDVMDEPDDGWQPIETVFETVERLDQVLVWSRENGIAIAIYGRISPVRDGWRRVGSGQIINPTHWMPMVDEPDVD